MGDFNADPTNPPRPASATPGSVSAFAAANGAEPAVTWPSGLQARRWTPTASPAASTTSGCEARPGSTSARLVFDRPDPEDATIYPSDHLGIAAQLEIG